MFANVLLVDEVNRASPKTQSALLEAMQETQVTVDGETYPLERPFLAIATQNPVDYEGTYPLPEAQLDRFAVKMSIGYPPLSEEARMLSEQTGEPPLDALVPVAGHDEVVNAIVAARGVFVFALLALAAAMSARRRLRASTTDPRRRASAARADLADFVRDQGSAIDASVPVHDLVAELRRIGISCDAFAAAFARARYGPPGGAVAAAEETWLEQRKVLSLLRGRLGPGSRIRGFLAVRSLRGS